jgi:hypothetical protein
MTAEAVLSALLKKDLDALRTLFPHYFNGVMLQFQELRPEGSIENWHVEQSMKVALAPLIDLMEVSGYSFILAGFHRDNDLKEAITSIWDAYFASDRPEKLSWINAVINFSQGSLEIPYRALIRTSWKSQVEQLMRTLPEVRVPPRRSDLPPIMALGQDERIIDHPNALVRIFGEPMGPMFEGCDVFISEYLRVLPESAQLNFGSRRVFVDSLSSAIRNQQELWERLVASRTARPDEPGS